MTSEYAIGIDLGTSNSALAYTAIAGDKDGNNTDTGDVRILPICQQLSLTATHQQTTLPSALYLCTEAEQRQLERLPWQTTPAAWIVGGFARDHGELRPQRLVSSAKSWLCSRRIDPQQPVLPWQAPPESLKISPFTAQVEYLSHLRHALLYEWQQRGIDARLEHCAVTITVPASFDEVARGLTAEAADAAGWTHVTLLEEPQAAFYHWLEQSGEQWRQQVGTGDVILVCDVGGGTADFSLIAVTQHDGDLHLERISVGDHILLGGDNMDLALAYTLKAELETSGKKIDAWQLLALTHSCRRGKEALYSDEQLQMFPISIPGRGSSLLASTVNCELTRRHLHSVVLDGFFPFTALAEQPTAKRSSGLHELGLDYASDPVLSKHIAHFLRRSYLNIESNPALKTLAAGCLARQNDIDFIRPSAVLFNGGIFKAEPIRRRVLELLQTFNNDQPLRELSGSHFDLAVATGAAVHARRQIRGEGVRIKAGTARSYYIGLESSMPAVPGLVQPLKALCVVPQGMEEGSECSLSSQPFWLLTGQAVEFRFFSSSIRAGDPVGYCLEDVDELEETARLEVTLPAISGQPAQQLPVLLHSRITALGTLELWMQHQHSDQRWKIEFDVRGQ